MNNKVKKVLFILTFVPYALVLLSGLWGAVFGADFLFSTDYGLDGFLTGALISLLYMTAFIPIIPVCIIFHLLCLIRKKVPFIKKISMKKFAVICSVICFAAAAAILPHTYFHDSYEYEKKIKKEKANAVQMSERADEKIAFNKHDIHCDGIFDMPEYRTDHIFIDYDKNEIGFLINAGYDEYFEIALAEASPDSSEYRHIADTYFVQADIPLSSPGKRLVSFYNEKPNIHRTVVLLLFYEDGRIFYADEMLEKNTGYGYIGLCGSEYFVFEENLKLADYENMNRKETDL